MAMISVVIWVAALSGILFILMGLDKWAAIQHRWRIPEKRLLVLGFLGGGAGGILGQILFRHKIRKNYFWLIYLIGCLFAGSLYWLAS